LLSLSVRERTEAPNRHKPAAFLFAGESLPLYGAWCIGLCAH